MKCILTTNRSNSRSGFISSAIGSLAAQNAAKLLGSSKCSQAAWLLKLQPSSLAAQNATKQIRFGQLRWVTYIPFTYAIFGGYIVCNT